MVGLKLFLKRGEIMGNVTTLQVKQMLIDTFKIEEDAANIADETAIVGTGLELDSVDVLEIILQVNKKFGVKLKNEDIKKEHFKTIKALTDFINSNIKS